jgi:hypothetical protein
VNDSVPRGVTLLRAGALVWFAVVVLALLASMVMTLLSDGLVAGTLHLVERTIAVALDPGGWFMIGLLLSPAVVAAAAAEFWERKHLDGWSIDRSVKPGPDRSRL